MCFEAEAGYGEARLGARAFEKINFVLGGCSAVERACAQVLRLPALTRFGIGHDFFRLATSGFHASSPGSNPQVSAAFRPVALRPLIAALLSQPEDRSLSVCGIGAPRQCAPSII